MAQVLIFIAGCIVGCLAMAIVGFNHNNDED